MFTVLLVEDEELERRYLKSLLEKSSWGYKVVGEACNGREGIELHSKLQPDIVFMDIRMPGIDGLSATKSIKTSNPNVKILILTAYDDFNYAKQAIHLGVDEYLLKPAQPKDIFEALSSITKSSYSQLNNFNGFFSKIDSNDFISANYPLELEKEIITALEKKDYKLFNNATDKLIQELFANCRNIGTVKMRIYELVIIISRVLNNTGYNPAEVQNFKLTKFREMENLNSLEVFKEYLNQFKDDLLKLVNLSELSSAEYSDLIISFINTHKADNISLSEISSYFHFSPCHISRLIRKKTGLTFPQYLNKIRLAEAKELLRNSDLDINVIASSVGYNEVSHFNRIFKKTLGLSPSKYRNLFKESKEPSLKIANRS
ncbi:MAG: response regulator transcription factor [Zhaonellaceae bacterium]